jgi:hypothetical protein
MLIKLLLLPLCLHVLLITLVGLRTVTARYKSVVSGETRLGSIATSTSGWPERVKQLGNNFDNQFDTPLLWYAVIGFVLVLKFEDQVFVVLSWAFLLTRVAHSIVHTGSNYVPLRMRMFLAGFAVLFAMWAWFTWRLLQS